MEKRGAFTDEQVFLDGLLIDYVQVIEATRRGLGRIPKGRLPRVGWDQVVNMAEKFAAEATSIGIIWHGDISDVKPLADNMEEYFGLLQRVLMLGRGATRNAGITLAACMRKAVDDLFEASMNLMKEAVLSYDCEKERNSDTIPKLIGLLWDAWIALGKIPINNVTAVGEALIQVAISVREKLRKMEEVQEASSDHSTEAKDEVSGDAGNSKEQQKEGSSDPSEKFEDKRSGDAEKDTEELKNAPFAEAKDEVCGDAGISKEQQKEGSSDPPQNFVDKPSGDAEKDTKELKDGSLDQPEKIKDEISGVAGSSTKQPKEGLLEKASANAGIGTNELKKDSSDTTKDSKNEVSGNEGSGLKEWKKAALVPSDYVDLSSEEKTIARLATDAVSEVLELMNQHGPEVIGLINKEREVNAASSFVDSLGNILIKKLKKVLKEAPFVSPVEVQDKASTAPSDQVLDKPYDEAIAAPSDKVQDELSGESNKEPKNAEHEPLVDAKAKPSVKVVKMIIKTKVSDLSPEDQRTIVRLTNDAASGLVELLDQLGPAVHTMLDKERERTVENFIDSVEDVLKLSKDIESQIEALFHPQDLIARRVAFTRVSRALRELAVLMHQLNGGHYSREFANAWTQGVQMMRKLAVELQRHNPAPAVEKPKP